MKEASVQVGCAEKEEMVAKTTISLCYKKLKKKTDWFALLGFFFFIPFALDPDIAHAKMVSCNFFFFLKGTEGKKIIILIDYTFFDLLGQ